jgi:hypothetical protein
MILYESFGVSEQAQVTGTAAKALKNQATDEMLAHFDDGASPGEAIPVTSGAGASATGVLSCLL